MPAVRVHVPKYCLHKSRGLAYVRDRGKVRYLGKHGSPESKEAYGRFLIEWEAHRAGAALPLPEPSEELTVVELCAAYLDYAEGYYRKHGQPTRSLDNIKRAIKAVKNLYGHQPAATFGPLCLLTFQRSLAASDATPRLSRACRVWHAVRMPTTSVGMAPNATIHRRPEHLAAPALTSVAAAPTLPPPVAVKCKDRGRKDA